MRISTSILILGLLVLGSAVGYALYSQHAIQTKLRLQLQQLDELLATDNDHAARAAEGTLKGLQAEVIKNQSQPPDLSLFAKAEAFAARADSLVRTLRARREALLRATDNLPTAGTHGLPHPDAAGAVAGQLAVNTSPYQNLTHQLTDYTLARRRLGSRDTLQLTAPAFEHMPVVAALAHLTRLESDVRATEIATLRQLAPRLGATKFTGHVVAAATAEANMVAPGTVYRARLYLAKVLQGVRVSMTCNGAPVRIAADGQGQVRFTAPQRPGPAVWVGTIHLYQHGRDSTFQVRVPYRVARR